MGNLLRIKQIHKPELSGYIEQVGDASYYSDSNPSGYISSLSQQADFQQLSGDLFTFSGDVTTNLSSTGQTLLSNLTSTGSTLEALINNVSGYVELSNADIDVLSGNVNTALSTANNYTYTVGNNLSGDVDTLSGHVVSQDSTLNTKINTVSGGLSSRVSSLEGVFAASGSDFVDVSSNNQVSSGQKTFNSRVDFKQINIVPVTGDYVNPGGLNNYLYTQYTDNDLLFVSGINGSGGYVTGDLFVTKVVYPNNEECIISSNFYSGNY